MQKPSSVCSASARVRDRRPWSRRRGGGRRKVPAPLLTYEAFVSETLAQYPLAARHPPLRHAGGAWLRGQRALAATVRPAQCARRPRPRSSCASSRSSASRLRSTGGYICKLRIEGATRQLWVFVMVLAYSRAMWAEPRDRPQRSLPPALARTRVQVLSAAPPGSGSSTIRRSSCSNATATRPASTPGCSRSLDSSAWHPELCGVRKPQQKGKVERAMRYLRERFFAARTIRDLERGNAELLVFLDEIANARPHPSMARAAGHRRARRGEWRGCSPCPIRSPRPTSCSPSPSTRPPSCTSTPTSTRCPRPTPARRWCSSPATRPCGFSTVQWRSRGTTAAGDDTSASRRPSTARGDPRAQARRP